MAGVDRRHGLWLLAGAAGAAALPLMLRRAVAQPAAGQTLALVEKGAGRLAFYALPDGRLLGSVVLGRQPHELAADPARRFAYVGVYGVASWQAAGAGGNQIWVIDLAARTLARTIDFAPYDRLHAVRTDASGRLYVLSEAQSVLARFDQPGETDTPARLWPVGGVRSHYLVVRRDGRRGYVADTLGGVVIALDLSDPARPPLRHTLGSAPEALALSRDERTLYAIDRPAGVIHALDAETLVERRRRTMRGEALRVVVQDDGRLIVANAADRSLSRLDPDTLAEQARMPLPAAAAGLMLAGDRLYAALMNDSIAIVELAGFTVSGGFATGKAPDAGVVY